MKSKKSEQGMDALVSATIIAIDKRGVLWTMDRLKPYQPSFGVNLAVPPVDPGKVAVDILAGLHDGFDEHQQKFGGNLVPDVHQSH